MAQAYTTLMKELARISAEAPKGKVPKQYNFDLYLPTPFHAPASASPTSATSLRNIPLRKKSTDYAASGKLSTSSFTSTKADHPARSSDQPPTLTDIPLPSVLQRHIYLPSPSLAKETQLGKITGFRIEVTGRRGTRSATQRFGYGRLGTGNVGGAYVDFAKSLYVHKKGVTGVKVWIGYGR
ncbi:hypothetical protein HKX48_009523 [Thoreauomyces humboldtii]|nr:hypothetical protein HKX48_009523 [Thoreauomyces humboldtii]